jgi:PAS domain S-box-containing protein
MFDIKNLINYTEKLVLLYVEDNQESREATYVLLKQLFKKVIVAVDGKDGLEKFKNIHIDLIITDLNMPNMSGAVMVRKIRKINNLIPTIVLTAHDENDYVLDSIKIGASSYLNKPLDVNKLFLAIYDSLDHSNRNLRTIYDKDNVFDKYNHFINPSSIVTIFDANGIVLYVNDTFSYIFGFDKKDIIGTPYYTLSKEKHDNELIDEIWQTIRIKKKTWSGTIRYVNNYDEVYFLKGSINPILDKYNEVIEFVAIREDITEQVASELKRYEL